MTARLARPRTLALLLLAAFLLVALARPVDHDESQYVAAAALTAHGLLPYRDYAYLQTPLQPFLLAPLAGGAWAWVALRLANAVLGWVAVAATFAAARAGGANARAASAAAGLFATCDILLFSIGTARNDALPAALLAVALWLVVRSECGAATRARALAIGLLLAAAAAAKISYGVPAATYGVLALIAPRRRLPLWVALGAVPVMLFVGWTAWLNPAGFVFGTLVFPSAAPADWYAARPWKLSWLGKLVDALKFLCLGPAIVALAAVARRGRNVVRWLLIAGLVAALMPTPTWRQYLLPALPPLFALLAWLWTQYPPARGWRIAAGLFATIGLVPTAVALAGGGGLATARGDVAAIRAALDRAGVAGPVASLSPQYVVAAGRLPEARFATGPFVFRGRAIVAPHEASALGVVPRRRTAALLDAAPPAAILTGGEALASGDARLDAILDGWAASRGYRSVAAGRFRLWVRSITP